jgi:hypothetical protein
MYDKKMLEADNADDAIKRKKDAQEGAKQF